MSAGHFSIDSIFLPNRQTAFTVLGGSVAYVSFAARRLDARVSVISTVGADFPVAYKWWLQQEGVDLSGVTDVQDALTTRFELRYNGDLSDRTLCSKNRMLPIRVQDLPTHLKARIIHLAPIADEITHEVAEKLRSCTEIVSLDPQGLIRKFDQDGNVTLQQPTDKSILGLIDVFKSTPMEIETLTGLSDLDSAIKAVNNTVNIVIVTLGAEGALVAVEDTIHRVPAYKPEKFVDPTGAGDAFMGAFLAEYARGEDCAWCSQVGSAAASLVVEGIGPTSFGDKEEIYRRARTLIEKRI
ncbi:MAG TPA: PfkB family carbohydrate kinase [candidate division Zixibacteria bacterium]|nr:PfkB family carbohydrate kinase [candidate division Zixibacteria bacterium]